MLRARQAGIGCFVTIGIRVHQFARAPSLPPLSRLDQRNEPAHLRHAVQLLAEPRGVGGDGIARRTRGNFYRIFRRCARPADRQARRRRHQASSGSV